MDGLINERYATRLGGPIGQVLPHDDTDDGSWSERPRTLDEAFTALARIGETCAENLQIRQSLEAQLRDTRARLHALTGSGWPKMMRYAGGLTMIVDDLKAMRRARRRGYRLWSNKPVKRG